MNKVILIGNLTKDPETKTTAQGTKVCNFTVAVNRPYSGVDGNRQTDFLPVICWRNQAENCGKYLKKGSKVGLCGSIQTRSYDAADGTKRYVTEIVADEVQFLSTKNESESDELAEIPEVQQRRAARIQDAKPVSGGDDDLPF